MKGIAQFVKTTLIGGALFLVPIMVLLFIVGKAHQTSTALVTPLVKLVPVEALTGPIAIRILALCLIVVFCFVAGLYAGTSRAKRIPTWLEANILANVPGYALIKSLTGSVAGAEAQTRHQPVLARIEDAWQLAFLVERLEDDHVAVFVPGAPNAMSGSVYFMSADRVRPLEVPLQKAIKCVQQLGGGAATLLAGRLGTPPQSD